MTVCTYKDNENRGQGPVNRKAEHIAARGLHKICNCAKMFRNTKDS